MSYEPHPRLVTPPDDTIVWRYLDFPRFVQLLEAGSLWFSRADILEDPLEAGYTDGELRRLNSLAIPADEQHIRRSILPMPPYMRVTSFVNCWCAGQEESMAMWDLYGKAPGSIAIKSTVGRLKEVAARANQKVFIGEVRYVDWREAPFDNNLVVMCVRKALSYRHECEIRMLIWAVDLVPPEIDGTQEPGLTELKKIMPPGISVSIDVQRTVTEVFVGPREPEWIEKLVVNILKRYNLSSPVVASDLLRARG